MIAEAAAPIPLSLDAFLAWEEEQELRYEFVAGVFRAMTGGTLEHNDTAENVLMLLRERLRGKPCRARGANTKVVTPTGQVLYPDVVVNCSPREPKRNWIDDPVVVVEVASPSTGKYDTTLKRWAYQEIPALRHMVLMAADVPRAEVATRNPDGSWTSVFMTGEAAMVDLEALAVTLPMRDIYEL